VRRFLVDNWVVPDQYKHADVNTSTGIWDCPASVGSLDLYNIVVTGWEALGLYRAIPNTLENSYLVLKYALANLGVRAPIVPI
jgi:hypothetical protein